MAIRQPKEQDDFANEPHSVDLRDYWHIIRRKWRPIVLLLVLGAAAGAGYSVVRGPSYAATAQVVVQPVTQAPLNQTTQATSQVNMSTEQAIAQSGPVIQRAAATLKIPVSRLQADVSGRLSVAVPASTLTTSNVLQITWQSGSRPAAQQGANAFAEAYLSYRHQELAAQIAALQSTLQQQTSSLRKQISQLSGQLAQTNSDTTRQVLTLRLNELSSQLNTADTQLAALPTYNDSGGSVIPAVNGKASGFGRSVLVVIGLILGLLLGLVLAFIWDLADDRIREAAQLERKLDAPALGVVSSADVTDRRRADLVSGTVAVATDPSSYPAAAARVLRATVMAMSSRRDLRTLLVVAADASVSASLVVADLGLAIAESGRRVLLIGSDTQGSVLPIIFGLASQPGLTEFVIRGGRPGAYTYPVTELAGHALPPALAERLTLLPGGQEEQAVSALPADQIAGLLRTQREAYDLVLLDAPSGAGADILTLASQVEGVMVLARQGRTRGRDLLALRNQLGQVGASVVGGVLVTKPRRKRDRQAPASAASPASYPSGAAPAAPEPSPGPETSAEAAPSAQQEAPPATGWPATMPLPVLHADDEYADDGHEYEDEHDDVASPVTGGVARPESPQ